jgi:hypothetical protein
MDRTQAIGLPSTLEPGQYDMRIPRKLQDIGSPGSIPGITQCGQPHQVAMYGIGTIEDRHGEVLENDFRDRMENASKDDFRQLIR